MRIIIISKRFWPEGSGGTLATYLITKLLALERDIRVTVLTGTNSPAKIEGVRFIIEPSLKGSGKPIVYLKSHLFRKRLEKVIAEHDVVYIPYGFHVIPIAKKLGKRVVVHLHDYQVVSYNSTLLSDQSRYDWSFMDELLYEIKYELYEHKSIIKAFTGATLMLLINALHRLWITHADAVICVSRRQAEIICSFLPKICNNLKVIYNPLPDIPLREKRLEQPSFMYLGGDSYVKGFHVFLKATYKALKRHPNIKFLLIKEFKNVNRAIIKKLNTKFGNAYILLGRLKYEEVLRLHSISYALLFPSIVEEPLPYAVLESMLAGTIPIASNVGGVPEIVEGTPAERLLFTPGSVGELVDRIEDVLSMSREELIDIGSKLRECTLRKFNRYRIKEQLLKVFHS